MRLEVKVKQQGGAMQKCTHHKCHYRCLGFILPPQLLDFF